MSIFMRTLASMLACLALLISCQKAKKNSTDILVSIPPYLFFVQELTEGELKAISLVPPGANPHLYEPTPQQVEEAFSAKVWIRLSEQFEKKLATALQEHNPHMVVVNVMDKIPSSLLLQHKGTCSCPHHHKESFDSHIWLSLRLAHIQAEEIAGALTQAFPERSSQIQTQLQRLQNEFGKVDEVITTLLAPYASEAILISHAALGYFCRDYHLKQISVEWEGKDPLPQQVASILEEANQTTIRTVFTQVQYNNKGAELLAQQLKLPLHTIDPYSADYLHNLQHITELIVHP